MYIFQQTSKNSTHEGNHFKITPGDTAACIQLFNYTVASRQKKTKKICDQPSPTRPMDGSDPCPLCSVEFLIKNFVRLGSYPMGGGCPFPASNNIEQHANFRQNPCATF